MSIRGWLLLACAGFGVTYLVGAAFRSPLLPSAELLAWLSLLAYVAFASRDAPTRPRLALAGGLAILALLAAVRLPSTMDSGSGTGLQFLAVDAAPRPGALELAGNAIWEAAPTLLAYACLALAALFLPRRHTRAGVAVAALGIAVAVTYAVRQALNHDDAGLAFAIAAVPPLLVATLAFVVAGQAPRWLPRVGLVLLGLAALALVGDVLDRVRFAHLDAFLQPGYRSYVIALDAPLDPGTAGWALVPAIQLAAAAVLTAGCLHTARPVKR